MNVTLGLPPDSTDDAPGGVPVWAQSPPTAFWPCAANDQGVVGADGRPVRGSVGQASEYPDRGNRDGVGRESAEPGRAESRQAATETTQAAAGTAREGPRGGAARRRIGMAPAEPRWATRINQTPGRVPPGRTIDGRLDSAQRSRGRTSSDAARGGRRNGTRARRDSGPIWAPRQRRPRGAARRAKRRTMGGSATDSRALLPQWFTRRNAAQGSTNAEKRQHSGDLLSAQYVVPSFPASRQPNLFGPRITISIRQILG